MQKSCLGSGLNGSFAHRKTGDLSQVELRSGALKQVGAKAGAAIAQRAFLDAFSDLSCSCRPALRFIGFWQLLTAAFRGCWLQALPLAEAKHPNASKLEAGGLTLVRSCSHNTGEVDVAGTFFAGVGAPSDLHAKALRLENCSDRCA